jgi:hypothetical protein
VHCPPLDDLQKLLCLRCQDHSCPRHNFSGCVPLWKERGQRVRGAFWCTRQYMILSFDRAVEIARQNSLFRCQL